MKSTFYLLALFMLFAACRHDQSELQQKSSELLKKIESDAIPPEQKKQFLDTTYNELLKYPNDTVTRNLLFKTSLQYYELGHYDKSLEISNTLYDLSVKEKDTAHIAKSLYFIGDYYEKASLIDSALHYYIQSTKHYKHLGDTLNIGRTTLYTAGILYDSGNYTESEIEAINALQLLLKTNDNRLIYECYNLIALSLEEQNNFEKALEYYNLALSKLDQLEGEDYPAQKILNSRASCYNNMGGVYEKQKEYLKAISIYNKGLSTSNLLESKPKLYAMLLNNLASAKMQSGDLRDVKALLYKSYGIRDSLKLTAGTLSSKLKIGEYYLYTKDTATAVKYFSDSYKLSKEIKSHHDILNSLKFLAASDLRNRAQYSALYIKVSDSLRNVERAARNKFARIAYEADTIEAKNELLTKQNTIIIISFGIGSILLVSLFAVYRLRAKNKELILIQEQQAANEQIYKLMLEQQSKAKDARQEERNKIAMDLHDGIVNKIFTTRFNLMQLETDDNSKKAKLVQELEDTQEEIRRVSHELKQNLLFEDKSFPELLESYVASQQPATNIALDIHVDKYINWQNLTTEAKIHLYRIVQELIHNVIKHSHATTCNIAFFKNENNIIVRIWDNGEGFDPDKIKKGIGLKNINERVKALNGTITIKAVLKSGTQIEIII